MGSKKSKPDDQQHLLEDTDEITVLFDKIKIVLIGCQKAGKNKIGNAILGKKAFTYWNTRKEHYLKDDNTTFGRRITLIRVPGWSRDLSSDDIKQNKLRQVIKDSMKTFKDGPHAVILVVKINTALTETTRDTLEKLLGSSVFEHTLVFSIDGEKISFATMTDHCARRRQTTIDICRKRYHLFKKYICGKQNLELIETIEDFIMKKKAIHFYSIGKEQPKPELQVEQLDTLVKRLKQRISDLTECISTLQSHNQTQTSKLQRTIELKNEEIKNLQAVLRQKEEALREMKEDRKTERLRSNQSTTEISALRGRITQLEDEGRQREKELQRVMEENEEKNAEIKTLKKENQELKDILIQNKQRGQIQRSMTRKGTEMESLELHLFSEEAKSDYEEFQASGSQTGPHHAPQRDLLCGWAFSLNQILNELTENQFKEMKDLLEMRDTWRIPAGLLDGRDRASVTKLLVQKWGEQQCIINTRDIMKDIPRNDKIMRDLFAPFLKRIGENW